MPLTTSRTANDGVQTYRSVIPRLLLVVGVLYAVLLLTFWLTQYEGKRPTAGRVVGDFHAFLGFGPSVAKAAPAVHVPPPPPKPAPKPAPPAPPPPPPKPAPRSALDEVASTVRSVSRDARKIRTLERGGALETERIRLVSQLTDARDVLGAILDENPDNDRANGLWDDMQKLLAALRKL